MEQVKEGRKVGALCLNFHPKKESEMQKMRGDEHSAAPNLLPEKTLSLPARVGEETPQYKTPKVIETTGKAPKPLKMNLNRLKAR